MDILNRLSNEIAKLSVGEQWSITAQELFLSRNDFQSISAYLCHEAKKGQFSITAPLKSSNHIAATYLTVIKH